MARTRGAVKRQKIATVELALFNPDVLLQLARYLNGRELCIIKSTCRKMGAEQTAFDGLSLAEEAARRLVESASGEEKACLPRNEDKRWLELYQHLLVRRSKLTFDLLLGLARESIGGDTSTLENLSGFGAAVCRRNVMRAGRHVACFSGFEHNSIRIFDVGLIRPIRWGNREWEIFEETPLPDHFMQQRNWFNPTMQMFWRTLIQQKTDSWGDSNVHCVGISYGHGISTMYWSNWEQEYPQNAHAFLDYEPSGEIALVLDYDKGTLGLLQNGTTFVLKDGLSGEYCWMVMPNKHRISIRRGK